MTGVRKCVLIALALTLSLIMCEKKTVADSPQPVEKAPVKEVVPTPDEPVKKENTDKTSPEDPVDKKAPGEQFKWQNDFDNIGEDLYCESTKVIDKPADDTPEWVIWKLYQHVLGAINQPEKDEEYFQKFYMMFRDAHKESWVKSQYWPRVKQHIPKYTRNNKDSAFIVCKVIKKNPKSAKFFIKSFSPKKSNHPITVQKESEGWQVDFFSY